MYLKLVKPNKKYLPSVKEAIKEYLSEPSKHEIIVVSKMIEAAQNNFADYFEETENDRLGINLKEGYVSHSVFWLVDGDKYIGTFDLRHNLTPYLKQIGGHIAYQIRPSEQRKGYACAGLKLCLKEAKKISITKVLLTCKEENTASYAVMHKVMLEKGGIETEPFTKDNVVNKRIWIWTTSKPTIYLICGFIGAGKTTYSQKLAGDINAVHLNPDEFCMKLFTPQEYETNWDKCFSQTVNMLWEKAAEFAREDKNVVFDLGFWSKKERQQACQKAEKLGFVPVIYYVYAPDDVLKKRISTRKGIIAEQNLKNFNKIKELFEAPSDDEFYRLINNC